MTLPAFTYPIPSLRGAPMQAVGSADRPLCALVAAAAAHIAGSMLGGAARLLTVTGVSDMLVDSFKRMDISFERWAGWVRAINRDFNCTMYPVTVGPFTLDPYQRETIERIAPYGGVMALGCGLGKTITAIAAAQRAAGHISTGRTRLWIVCPLNAIPTWNATKEYLHFDEVQIISMDSLHKIADAVPSTGGVVIFDEAHKLGDASSRRTKAAHMIRPKFDAGFCLTGTMLHGGIEKALSLQDLAVPGLARFANRWKAGEYFKCLVKVKIGNRTVTELKRPVGIAKEVFMEYLAHGSVNMTKDSAVVKQTVNLPSQELHLVEIGDCTRNLDEIAAECALKILAETGEIPHAQEVAHALCAQGLEEKIDWLMNEMDDPSQQVAVFAHYTNSLDKVEEALKAANIPYGRIDGTTNVSIRQIIEREFTDRTIRVILGQQIAAGISMNLQAAYISVLIDHSWLPDAYDQTLGRTCRRGQEHACYHFDLIANQLQRIVVKRLRDAMGFNADAAEWQSLKNATLIIQNHEHMKRMGYAILPNKGTA